MDAIASFVAGMDRDDFAADRKTVYAVVRALEIVSEALRRIGEWRMELTAGLRGDLEGEQFPLTPAQKEELERRLNSLDRDRCEGISWAALKAELERRCP